MHSKKLNKIIYSINREYLDMLFYFVNTFLQETLDSYQFNEQGAREISTEDLLNEIVKQTSRDFADLLFACAVEFCITNVYPYKMEDWNCIEHIIKHHSKMLTKKDVEYLEELNNSHMGIYRVFDVNTGVSVVLQDQIQKRAKKITVIDKSFSTSAVKGIYIGARIVKQRGSDSYKFSSIIIEIPKPVLKPCVNTISEIKEMMFSRNIPELLIQQGLKNDKSSKLLAKKMWAKEIAECVYLYRINYTDYHDILDRDGNPWYPCIIEFDINTPPKQIHKSILSIKEITLDHSSKQNNKYLWCTNKYKNIGRSNLKKHLPKQDESHKDPIYHGSFITNKYDGTTYSIFAELQISSNKLIVNVDSKQRANIVEDRLTTELGDMLSNPKIYQAKSKIN